MSTSGLLRLLWLPLVLSSCCIARICAGEDDELEKLSPEECRELIARLVSPNNPPTTIHAGEKPGDRPAALFPKGYDFEAQERIDEARHKLRDNIIVALPYLIDAQNDNRYCMTTSFQNQEYSNWTVGLICQNILESQFEVYYEPLHINGPTRWKKYHYRPLTREWYQNRKDLDLAGLQYWAVEWAIAVHKTEKPNTIDTPKADVFEQELIDLTNLRDDLRKTGKPRPASDLRRMVNKEVPPRKRDPPTNLYSPTGRLGPQG